MNLKQIVNKIKALRILSQCGKTLNLNQKSNGNNTINLSKTREECPICHSQKLKNTSRIRELKALS